MLRVSTRVLTGDCVLQPQLTTEPRCRAHAQRPKAEIRKGGLQGKLRRQQGQTLKLFWPSGSLTNSLGLGRTIQDLKFSYLMFRF